LARRHVAKDEDCLAGVARRERSNLIAGPAFDDATPHVVDGVDPRALRLLDGLGGPADGERPSARLFVYQRNVERIAGAVELGEAEIRGALEREIRLTFLEPAPEDPRVLN
jgi:hypothetical protein